jgi:hypothetical protein
MDEMSEEMKAEWNDLREEFARIYGVPFVDFYYPILQVDEPAQLCFGHIVNKKVASSTRKCVVQRHDVDDFYGKHFGHFSLNATGSSRNFLFLV